MPQPEKIKKVEQISERLEKAKSIFMADFSGLTVEEMTELRTEFRKNDVEFLVVKNTLAKLSAKKVGFDNIDEYLSGPTGLALGFGDPVAPVRVIAEYNKSKKKEKPVVKAAILEGQVLNKENAEELKNIPPREVLLGQVVSGIASPLTGLVGGLKAVLSQLVYTLDAIKEKKED